MYDPHCAIHRVFCDVKVCVNDRGYVGILPSARLIP